MARRRRSLRSPAVLAGVAATLVVLSVISVVTLKVLPDCWRDHPTWSAGQCLEEALRSLGPLARRPPVKPVVPPQLTLTWTDNSGGQAGVIVERRLAAESTFAQLATVPPGQVSYVDTAVAAGAAYCYRLKASNAAGESAYTGDSCGSTASAGLAVTVSKQGSGTVTSTPGGITCGTVCQATYTTGTVVTLNAAAASGSVFTGWTGGGCSGTGPCALSGNVPVSVTAAFGAAPPPPATTYPLTVSVQGSGGVNSTPSGIACTPNCQATYPTGTVVTLSTTVPSGSVFTGWSGGGCSGTGPCTLTTNAAVSVTATFGAAAPPPPPPPPPPATYTLTVAVSGQGTVVSAPAGITCGADCSEAYAAGTAVTLSAAAASGSVFTGWSGGGCSGTGPCTLTVNAPVSATATFGAAPPPPPSTYTLTVVRSGQGTVVSSPAGITCGGDCSVAYAAGTVVTLSALPKQGFGFSGWTGGGCSGTAPCTVTLGGATQVTAKFVRAKL